MRAFQIPRHPEAFALDAGGKRKRARVKDESHLDFIRGLPSCISGTRPVDACHVRFGDPRYGKRATGAGEKPSDQWVLPATRAEHEAQHACGDERQFWLRYGIDPLALALKLWGCTGDYEAAEAVIRDSVATARTMVGAAVLEERQAG